MSNLNVLFLTHRGEGYVGAPQTRHEFEQEVAKHCNCKFAGEGWSLYRAGESMDETVKRVMSNVDLVIDSDNNLHNKKPINRRYKIGHVISDIHAKHYYKLKTPLEYVNLLNKVGYDVIFMRYPRAYGTKHPPDTVYSGLTCDKQWVPWSIKPDKFKQKRKTVDAALIGTINNRVYPLRQKMWDNWEQTLKNYNTIRQRAPTGKTYDRSITSLKNTHIVGDQYCDVLAKTNLLTFGCSVYRYALQKFFEGAASQCVIISDKPDAAERLGFIDGKTYVCVNKDNWGEKTLYLLENHGEARRIARMGMKNVLLNHSHEKRAKQWIKTLSD